MATYHVSFDIEIPVDASREEVEAFIRFELGEVAVLKVSALSNTDFESCEVSNVFVD